MGATPGTDDDGGSAPAIIFTAHGRPASRALAEAIARAKADGPFTAVTVVVPSNFAGLASRRLLGSGALGGRGIANVSFRTPFRLAEMLAGERTRPPLTNSLLTAAVRAQLAAAPGPFARVSAHQATERALASTYAELSHLDAPVLERLRGAGGTVAAMADLHEAIAARLRAYDDEDDVAERALERVRRGELPGAVGTVIWHLPQPMSPALARLVSACVRRPGGQVILGRSGDADADAPVDELLRRAGVVVEPSSVAVEPPLAETVISVTDPDEEVRAVVRRIVDLIGRGIAADRIGVFTPIPNPYLRSLAQQLAQAGIAANGPSPDLLSGRASARTLLAALALHDDWARSAVMAVAAGAPVLHRGQPAPVTAWERISRRAGVIGGLDGWHDRLSAHRNELRDGIAANGSRADLRRDLLHVDSLESFVVDLQAHVAAVHGAGSWAARVAASRALVDHLLGDATERGEWPEAEVAASAAVDDALERLARLDEIEPGPSYEVFVRALAGELDSPAGRHHRFGHGVTFGPLSGAIGADLDAVFVLGMAEGILPAPRRDDALVPESARLLTEGQLRPRSSHLHDQHRWFLAALAAAPAPNRFLLHSRGDLRSGHHRLPSRWLLPSVSALAGSTVRSTSFGRLSAPVVDVVPSFASGILDPRPSADLTERDLAAVLRHVERGGSALDHPAASAASAGLHCQHERASDRFTRFDGNLAGAALPDPTSRPHSASALESWSHCGMQHLLARVLEIEFEELPEDAVILAPKDRGTLLHGVLEQFFSEVIQRGGIAPDEPWTSDDRSRACEILEEAAADLARRTNVGRPLHFEMEIARLRSWLLNALVVDASRRQALRTSPVAVELAFGFASSSAPALEIDLGEGRSLAVRGVVDRIDRTTDGTLVVYDYKTGRISAQADLDADPFAGGTSLQLGIYAEAAARILDAEAAEAWFWTLDPSKGGPWSGFSIDDDARTRLTDVLRTIVEGMSTGTFPMQPGEFDNWRQTHGSCTYCAFDHVCPVSRGEQADAKSSSPELAVRRRLVPVDVVADADADAEVTA